MSPLPPWRPPPPRTAPSPAAMGRSAPMSRAMRLVTPRGEIREINERDNPEEMQIMRSSYGLLGIVFEVTIKVRPTTALSVRHHSMGLRRVPQALPGVQGARLRGDVLHLSLCAPRRRRAQEGQSRRSAKSRRRWAYRNRFWRKYGPALAHWIRRRTRIAELARPRPTSSISSSCARGWCASCATTRPGRMPSTSTTRAIPGPTNICSACGPSAERNFFKILEEYCDSVERMTRRRASAATCLASATPSLRIANALLSYCWDGATLSIDPASTGGKEWEEFLRAYNDFCSARGGVPLFNQTPFLTARAGAEGLRRAAQAVCRLPRARPIPRTACSTAISATCCPTRREISNGRCAVAGGPQQPSRP